MRFRCLDEETVQYGEYTERLAGGRVPDDVERLLEAELLLHRVLRATRTNERELVAVEAGEIAIAVPSPDGSLEHHLFFLCALLRDRGWRLMVAPARRTDLATHVDTNAGIEVLSAGTAVRIEVMASLDAAVHELLGEAAKHAGRRVQHVS